MKQAAFLLLVLGPPWVCTARGAEAPGIVTYEQHVRPLLKTHCFLCHGEAGEREGSLDLRLQRLMVAGGDSGPAVVPGKPDESLLVERLRAGEMPPGDKKLSTDEIDTIARWIAAGAKTARPEPEQLGDDPLFTDEERQYWAFQSIRRPPLPSIRSPELVRTPIDAFLLARLEREQLSFSPAADRPTLIRRAGFDLLGLPPAPQDVEAYMADESPDAWERLVDRLLASPHYGERWGRHWLDVAGYADSEGYTEDDPVRAAAFRYRDYVIRAFNDNKPFDRFVQEQLAGDELVPLPHANLTPEAIETLAATGFLRMAPDGTAAGGIDQNIARNQVVADTLQIVSSSLLGMTVACAQCHDHRYDPISHVDYFRLRAVFEPALDWKSWKPPRARLISLYTDDDRKRAAEIQAEAAQVDKQRQAKVQEFIDLTLSEELEGVAAELRDPLRAAYKTSAKERTPEQQALLKEHPSIANISPGSLYLYDRGRIVKAQQLEKQLKEQEPRVIAETAARELENVPADERDAVQQAREAAVEQRTPEQTALLEKHPGVLVTAATLDRFNSEAAGELKTGRESVAALRAAESAKVLKVFSDQAAEIRARIPEEEFIRALSEPSGPAPATFLFHRGDHEQPKQQIPPGDLTILAAHTTVDIPTDDPALPTTGRRLAFARHLTNGHHPLTARVIVNRIWLHHFGRGIVNSPADFGVLGDRPTHPELLDWLASEFMASGWDVKHIHRLIMTSTVYRQSSRRRPGHDAVDPENALYARMSIRRLEAEVVRDALLSLGGRRSDKMFGPPVPVMEDDVGQVVIGQENLDGERKPGQSAPLHGDEFRRSVYVQVRRSRPLSMLETFDAPMMAPNCENRSASTAAAQSLVFMNSGLVIENAGQFADRVRLDVGEDARAQIDRAWRLALGRIPSTADVDSAQQFLTAQRSTLRDQSTEADAAAIDRQALASFCHALVSTNAFLYVD